MRNTNDILKDARELYNSRLSGDPGHIDDSPVEVGADGASVGDGAPVKAKAGDTPPPPAPPPPPPPKNPVKVSSTFSRYWRAKEGTSAYKRLRGARMKGSILHRNHGVVYTWWQKNGMLEECDPPR